MAIRTSVPIIEGVFVANSLASLYKVGTDAPLDAARTRVDNISFTNITGGPITLTVQIIESGGSAGNAKIVVDNESIAANSTFEPSSLLQGLAVGDDIQAIAGSASAINVRATGTIFTT